MQIHSKEAPAQIDISGLQSIKREGNVVFGAALSIAWHKFASTTEEKKLLISSENPEVMKIVDDFNKCLLKADIIREADMVCQFGQGSEVYPRIQKQLKQKFPADKVDLGQKCEKDIVSFCYLAKNLSFDKPFQRKKVDFMGKKYEGFSATPETKQNVTVVYQDFFTGKFILNFKLKQKGEEMFVAVGYQNPPDIGLKEQGHQLGPTDLFQMPVLAIDQERKFHQLVNLPLRNKGYQSLIREVRQVIKFRLNEKGAQLKNLGVVKAMRCMPRDFRVNKPFWLLLRQRGMPFYFMARIGDQTYLAK